MSVIDNSTPRLLRLADLMMSLVSAGYSDALPHLALRGAMDLVPAEAGLLVRLEGESLRVISVHGIEDLDPGRSFPSEDPLRELLGVSGPISGQVGEEAASAGLGLIQPERCYISAPILVPSGSWGGIVLFGAKDKKPLLQEDLDLLARIASALGTSLHRQRIFSAVSAGQAHWQAIFDCITDAILLQDDESIILRANAGASRLAGIDLRDLSGRRANEVFPLPAGVSGDPFRRVIESGEPYSFETSQGGRQFLVSAFPIGCIEEGSRMCVHIRKDVSELKRLQSQLYDTEKLMAVGRLVSGVAHEINNPLTGVIGYAELLLRRPGEGMPIRELKKILDSALRCKSIVENLLAFSRQKPQERQQINVNDIIENTLQLRSYWLRHGHIEVIRHYGDLPSVLADPQLIQQAVMNIVENAEDAIARTHRKEGGTLTIETFHAAPRVLISITDNGGGIPEELLSRIFDPFFTTKEVGKGAGLGLSSAYGIIRDHGGDLRVQSRLGEGTTFIIELNRT